MAEQAKLNEKYMSFGTLYFKFQGTSYKRIQDKASLPVSLFLVLHRIRIYISRYHFKHSLENDFRLKLQRIHHPPPSC